MKVVYCIRNIITNDIYIGSTKNFKRRVIQHRSSLNLQTHKSHKLQAAWDEHGEHNFDFDIIEYLNETDDLIKKEQLWMNFYNPEYNTGKFAESPMKGRAHTKKSKEKISTSKTGSKMPQRTPVIKKMYSDISPLKKTIIQMDENMNEIDRYPSLTEAAKTFKVVNTAIGNATRRGNRSCGYYWKYA